MVGRGCISKKGFSGGEGVCYQCWEKERGFTKGN